MLSCKYQSCLHNSTISLDPFSAEMRGCAAHEQPGWQQPGWQQPERNIGKNIICQKNGHLFHHIMSESDTFKEIIQLYPDHSHFEIHKLLFNPPAGSNKWPRWSCGWWFQPTPLKNMSLSLGMMKFPIYWKKNPNVPNHQPEVYVLYI